MLIFGPSLVPPLTQNGPKKTSKTYPFDLFLLNLLQIGSFRNTLGLFFHVFSHSDSLQTPKQTIQQTYKPTETTTWPGGMRAPVLNQINIKNDLRKALKSFKRIFAGFQLGIEAGSSKNSCMQLTSFAAHHFTGQKSKICTIFNVSRLPFQCFSSYYLF